MEVTQHTYPSMRAASLEELRYRPGSNVRPLGSSVYRRSRRSRFRLFFTHEELVVYGCWLIIVLMLFGSIRVVSLLCWC